MSATAIGVSDSARERARTGVGIASFPPPIRQNPYQGLLYRALERYGYRLDPSARLKAGWLLAARGRIAILHFHWPQSYYRHERGPVRLRPALSWLRLPLFAARLRLARLLGFRIAWTVHQVAPHEGGGARLDRLGARVLARSSSVVIAHDLPTLVDARNALGSRPPRQRAYVIPHGTFADVYARGRERSSVRAELGIADRELVFLCFGHVRAYKRIDLLLDAFAQAGLADARLVIAGLPVDDDVAAQLHEAASRDPRIVLRLGFVPDECVAELHAAADVAVLPRCDGGTSGALVLALSLGTPVIAADTPAYASLTRRGSLGWLFEPGDASSLAAALRAASDGSAAVTRRVAAGAASTGEDWELVGSATHAAFSEILE